MSLTLSGQHVNLFTMWVCIRFLLLALLRKCIINVSKINYNILLTFFNFLESYLNIKIAQTNRNISGNAGNYMI